MANEKGFTSEEENSRVNKRCPDRRKGFVTRKEPGINQKMIQPGEDIIDECFSTMTDRGGSIIWRT